MSENNENFEQGSSKNKDFWLFLIFIDIIALAFFGFIIYQGVFSKYVNPPVETEKVAAAPAREEAVVRQPQPQPVLKPAPKPVRQADAKPESNPEEKPIEKPAETQPAKPADKPAAKPAAAPAKPARESVLIEPTKGKTRKVTFRYFGAGKNVQISSGFTMAKPQNMKKTADYWEASFNIYPGEYKFIYIVDGKYTLDPYSEEKDGRSFVKID